MCVCVCVHCSMLPWHLQCNCDIAMGTSLCSRRVTLLLTKPQGIVGRWWRAASGCSWGAETRMGSGCLSESRPGVNKPERETHLGSVCFLILLSLLCNGPGLWDWSPWLFLYWVSYIKRILNIWSFGNSYSLRYASVAFLSVQLSFMLLYLSLATKRRCL